MSHILERTVPRDPAAAAMIDHASVDGCCGTARPQTAGLISMLSALLVPS